MKLLKDILYKVPILEVKGNPEVEINDFHFDSRKVGKGDLFIAIKGTNTDGHSYIKTAIQQGATAIICEILPEAPEDNVQWVKVQNSAKALAYVAANFYDNPADKLELIGVTGTNGKTTVTSLLHQLFLKLGHEAGLLSTVQIKIGEETLPATHTTPDPKQLHSVLAQMVEAGCSHCFMEVSSHAIAQHRVTGIPFKGAVFTNLSHDHLDYHKTFAAYRDAKKVLFDQLKSDAFALVNADDKNGAYMLQNTKAHTYNYALKSPADYKGKLIENTFEGLLVNIHDTEIWFRLVGAFNAYNLLAVFGVANLLGNSVAEVLTQMSMLEPVNGRFQALKPHAKGPMGIVDYAHTPDALENVLKTIREINDGKGKVITVVGCGGNRDKEKRPVMGKIAAELSDQLILTSDNPRNEAPDTIIKEILNGVAPVHHKKILTLENRREAIKVACKLAQPSDIILVAGKGHETYQEIKGERFPFDDRKELWQNLKER